MNLIAIKMVFTFLVLLIITSMLTNLYDKEKNKIAILIFSFNVFMTLISVIFAVWTFK